jgi:hypothetical protein
MLYPTITDFFTGLQDKGYWFAKDYGNAKLPELWHLSSVLMVFVFAQAIFLMLYLVAKLHLKRPDALQKASAEGGD